MIDIRHHPHRQGKLCRAQPLLQCHTGGNGFAKFAPDAHRFPEQVTQTGRFGVFRHFRPAVNGDGNQRFTPRRIVKIPLGKDGKLRPHRNAAQFRGDVGKGLEPVNVIATYRRIRMTKMVEAAIRAGHAGGDAHAGGTQRLLHAARHVAEGGGGPAGIDKFMRQLQIANADLLRHGVNQIAGIGEAVHQRI
ncbi:hypothetical protein COLO4_01192, partial [Corchorus olitorius]